MTFKMQAKGAEDEFETILRSRNVTKSNDVKKEPHNLTAFKSNVSYLKLIGAAMILVLSALIAAWAVMSAGNKVPVIVLIKSVSKNSKITSQDLGTALISNSSNVNDISASLENEVVGKYAVTSLVSGQILAEGDSTSFAPLSSNLTLVGIPLKIGQEPTNGLQVGEHVIIVFTPQPGSTPAITSSETIGTLGINSISNNTGNLMSPGSVLDSDSTVVSESIPNPNLNSDYADEVTVSVPVNLGPIISLAASADQISLDLISK